MYPNAVSFRRDPRDRPGPRLYIYPFFPGSRAPEANIRRRKASEVRGRRRSGQKGEVSKRSDILKLVESLEASVTPFAGRCRMRTAPIARSTRRWYSTTPPETPSAPSAASSWSLTPLMRTSSGGYSRTSRPITIRSVLAAPLTRSSPMEASPLS